MRILPLEPIKADKNKKKAKSKEKVTAFAAAIELQNQVIEKIRMQENMLL